MRLSAEESTHVRPVSAAARHLIDEAARYPTVKGLIDRVERSDTTAYIQLTGSPSVPTASTSLVAATAGRRYLRVLIHAGTPAWRRPQILAHELQHVLEIAEEPEVVNNEGIRNLYRRIGHSSGGIDRFETHAAKRVEELVRGEMVHARR